MRASAADTAASDEKDVVAFIRCFAVHVDGPLAAWDADAGVKRDAPTIEDARFGEHLPLNRAPEFSEPFRRLGIDGPADEQGSTDGMQGSIAEIIRERLRLPPYRKAQRIVGLFGTGVVRPRSGS